MSSLKSILNQKTYGFFIKGVDENGIPCMIRVAGEWTNKRTAMRDTRRLLNLDSRKLQGEIVQL